MKVLISILLSLSALPIQAASLTEFPEPPKDILPIDTMAPPIACDEIITELMKFQDMNRQHEDSVISFLTQTVDKISGWYDQLAPLEGQTNNLQAGTFAPLKDGAEKMSRIVDYSYDNTALLASELDRIIVSLRDCPPAPPKK